MLNCKKNLKKFFKFEKKFFCGIPQKIQIPLFTPFHIPQNSKIFHGIPHVESAFYLHPYFDNQAYIEVTNIVKMIKNTEY
jgi:hypothetical protein